MNEDGALFDARFDDGGPFRDTPEPGGISLEAALRDFGPAAFDDLIPRVRELARVLDAAHRAGIVHGALHPDKIFVTDERTSLVKGTTTTAPYQAPEVAEGDPPSAAADLFALAAITYEWMFGKRIDGPAHRTIDVKAMPGVDRTALAKAFSRALAPAPEVRFASCTEFCDALAAASTPELPLLALNEDDDADAIDPVGPFVPETPTPDIETPADVDEVNIAAPFVVDPDDPFFAEDKRDVGNEPDVDALDPIVPAIEPTTDPEPVPSWNPPAAVSSTSQAQRFSGMALILATIVGSIFGFAAGYMARPRALQSGPVETFAVPQGTDSAVTNAEKPVQKTSPAAPAASETSTPTPASKVEAPKVVAKTGRLLVRSAPAGATVSIDGVERGGTPLALRDVEFGTHTITIARQGYVTEERKIAITSDRPSRSVDVRLTAQATRDRARTQAQPQSQPQGQRAAATGSMVVESRPTGATVTIDGRQRGVTPLTVTDLAPGDHRVVISMTGFVDFTTTVRVVAGERVRAAARLTAQEQE